jgi:hypothetical protein
VAFRGKTVILSMRRDGFLGFGMELPGPGGGLVHHINGECFQRLVAAKLAA